MSPVICGHYRFHEATNSLVEVGTRQSIRLTHQSRDGGLWFDYIDDETAASFVIEKTIEEGVNRFQVLVDFNRSESNSISTCYGLWRRVTFFLLDSLCVWFCLMNAGDEKFWLLDFLGCWKNGLWNPSATISVRLINYYNVDLTGPLKQGRYSLAPLDLKPIPWRYEENLNPPLEFSLQTDPTRSKEVPLLPNSTFKVPVLAASPGILDQLRLVPFFAREDGGAFLYHRYVEASGTGMSGSQELNPYYGYLNDRCGYTVVGRDQYYGISSFKDAVLRSEDVVYEDCFTIGHKIGDELWMGIALPMLEDLFFALIDISALTEANCEKMPVIAPRNDARYREILQNSYGQRAVIQPGVAFGENLRTLHDLPITDSLTSSIVHLTGISEYPPVPRGVSRHSIFGG